MISIGFRIGVNGLGVLISNVGNPDSNPLTLFGMNVLGVGLNDSSEIDAICNLYSYTLYWF